MIYTYQFRLFPSKKQYKKFLKQLEVHRELYNNCLQERVFLYSEKISVSGIDQIKSKVPNFKGLSNYSSLQQTVRRLDKSYKKFFKEKKGFPRLKNRFRTIQYSKHGDGIKVIEDRGLVYVQMIGNIPCKFHRKIEGVINTVSLTLKQGNMYVNVTVKREVMRRNDKSKAVGIDFGMKSCITTSDGQSFKTPSFQKIKSKDIARLQRKKVLEPKNKKINKAITKCYTKVQNCRSDYNHKLSRYIVDKYDIFCIENIEVKKMMEGSVKRGVNRKWSDLAIADLKHKIIYKAENAGKIVAIVNPAYTTQTCSSCGSVAKMNLDQRLYECESCHAKIDRDENAAINILRLGLESLA